MVPTSTHEQRSCDIKIGLAATLPVYAVATATPFAIGVGVPASDRAGVWGGALVTARTCAPARKRRGASGSPQAIEPGCGAEPW